MAIHYTISKFMVKTALRLGFYSRYEVLGLENVPKDGGVIFAANHQNALIDAFNVVTSSGRDPWYATRADVFEKPIAKKLLHSYRMVPIFRPRDGWKNMANNNETFDFLTSKLLAGESIGIFPEGQPSYNFSLLPFKKGAARLAFKAQSEKPDFPIYIVPVGLQYGELEKFRSDLLIQFGKPINVQDYLPLYVEKAGKANRELTLEIRKRIEPLMINISDQENYDAINFARKENGLLLKYGKGTNLKQEFDAGKDLVAEYEQAESKESLVSKAVVSLSELPGKWKSLQGKVHKESGRGNVLFFLLQWFLFPLNLLGILSLPMALWIYNRTIKNTADKQFITTSLFGHGFLLFPIYYGILAIIFSLLFWKWWVYFIAIIILPIAGVSLFNFIREIRIRTNSKVY